MATENINGVVKEVKEKLSNKDLSVLPEKLAVQVNLTGKITGVFYIEVFNGSLSVEPYEYVDRDGEISLTRTNLKSLISGKLKLNDSKVMVSGNTEKIMMLDSVLS